MTDVVKPKGRVRLYACGGAAINIAGLIGSLPINPDLVADFEIVQIDTSLSNITTRAGNVENYLLPAIAGTDGGGKDRTENMALIAEHTKPILKAHGPRDLNIVLSSGSGSSGSVAAPNLVSELLARGEATIPMLIGTTSSRKEALNTLETLKNYEQIAAKRGAPVVLHYLQNSPTLLREQVNQRMLSAITYLGILFSRRNREMDTMDLINWLFFTKPEITKGLKPQLYSLTILLRQFGGATQDQATSFEDAFMDDLDKLGNVLSVATLARDGVVTDLPDDYMPEYQTVGFVQALKDLKAFETHTANYFITDGLVEQYVADLRSFARREKKVVSASSLLSDSDDEVSGVNF